MSRHGLSLVVLASLFGILANSSYATTFSLPVPIITDAPGTVRIVHGDLNGDQLPDIIVPQDDEPRFVWLERNNTVKPEYTTHRVENPYPYGRYMSLGDLDEDGDLDVISTGSSDPPDGKGHLVWRENDGTSNPSFTTHMVDNDHHGRKNLVADIDSDGDADILSATQFWGARIRLYSSDGLKPPGFTNSIVYEIPSVDGTQPEIQDFEVVDFDRDGHLDIICADGSDRYADSGGRIHWLQNLNTDPPSFKVHELYLNAWFAYDVALGDFDGDGDPDLVASFLDGFVIWFENVYPSDPAVIPHRFQTTEKDPLGVVVVDVDLDTDLDFFVLHGNGDTIYFYENDPGFPSRFSPSLFDQYYRPYHMTPSDLDADGDPDLIFLSGGLLHYHWYENLLVQEGSVIDVDPLIRFESSGMEGGEFYPDRFEYVVSNHSLTQSFEWMVQPDVPWVAADPPQGILAPKSGTSVTVSFNDFTKNLISGNYTATLDFTQVAQGLTVASQEIALRIISRYFRFFRYPAEIANTSSVTYNFEIADLNGDGLKDILCVKWHSQQLYWIRQTPEATNRFRKIRYILPTTASRDLFIDFSVGDLDGDGDLDLATMSANGLAQSLDWHENDGADQPSLQSHPVAPDFLYGSAPKIVDVDGDNDNDIIVGSRYTHAIYWFENDGNTIPGFTRHVLSSEAVGTDVYESIPVDLDDDGDMDLLTRTHEPWRVSWFEQLSGASPSFRSHLLPAQDGYIPSGMTTADFNGDGLQDVVVTYWNDARTTAGKIIVFENHLTEASPYFWVKVIDESIINPDKVDAADLDHDGDVDLFVLEVWQKDDNRIYYLENQDSASYSFATVLFREIYRPRHIRMDDIDLDGDLDILLHELSDMVLYENTEHPRTPARTWMHYK